MTERELLAAEIALRLLSDEEQALLAQDPKLAALVAAWEARLAPMAEELPPVEPSPQTWQRIAAAQRGAGNDNDGGQIDQLRTRLRRWQMGSAAAAAAALVLGLFTAPLLDRSTAPNLAPPVLVASLPVGSDAGPRLGLTYLPQSGDLVVEAAGVAGDGVHDHELWLVVPDAKPVSMGVVQPGRQSRVHLSPELAGRIDAGLGVVLTREPLGGAPQGGSAGPVVATGKFSTI
ncbi:MULTISPECIES: anti-sigma factor [unclassified Novosphingobium]|uniref:anti-sigma factor n=1 Tax=unclassified Novosphingobium TaxID=2644732 RepID=UPI0025DF8BFB|nr:MULTISPECIES: anti-sigma factor [unclassified Novosphingobium]HQV03098.1 anti-sigma factor [Novosphingobium sp.]